MFKTLQIFLNQIQATPKTKQLIFPPNAFAKNYKKRYTYL